MNQIKIDLSNIKRFISDEQLQSLQKEIITLLCGTRPAGEMISWAGWNCLLFLIKTFSGEWKKMPPGCAIIRKSSS
jgi:hypothetical protein